jgi:hypothetical protein
MNLNLFRYVENPYKSGMLPACWHHYCFFILNQIVCIMRVLETKTHGCLDYVLGALLMAVPWAMNFDRGGAETWTPVILGIALIVLALITDYEVGAFRQIGMQTHLTIDLMNGALLGISPWLFGFSDVVWVPHLVYGMTVTLASVTTKQHPSKKGTQRRQTFAVH